MLEYLHQKQGSPKNMKIILVSILFAIFSINSFSQTNDALVKLVDEEKAFAAMAKAKGNKVAFLEYLSKDAIVFEPGPVNAHEFWSKRPDSPDHYSWFPVYADISSNGVLGYTTGPWEFSANGQAFQGHYISVWQKQPDGKLRAVLDIGISHDKVSLSNDWRSPSDTGKEANAKKISAADSAVNFYETAEKQSAAKAYKMFAGHDIRFYREGKQPLIGKQAALDQFKKSKAKIKFAKRSSFVSAADLAYISNGYTVLDENNKPIETGNFLQIWKLRNGKWEIVIDLFAPLPPA